MELVDRLAELRIIQRSVRREIAIIKRRLMSGSEPLIGENYVAEVQQRITLKRIGDIVVNGALPATQRDNGVRGEAN